MFENYIQNFSVKNKKIFSFLLLILLVLSVFVMRYFDSFLINKISKNGIVSFELAKELSNSVEIINKWDSTARSAAGISLGFDFLFLIIYSSFLAMLILKINNRLFLKSKYTYFINVSFLLPFIAAFFDIIENVALVKLLLGDLQQRWSSLAFYSAAIKFGILAIVVCYIVTGGLILIFKKK